jgi:hypothetical protein
MLTRRKLNILHREYYAGETKVWIPYVNQESKHKENRILVFIADLCIAYHLPIIQRS